MTDKKLTDNEIIKALECCLSNEDGKCEECPLRRYHDEIFTCLRLKQEYTFALINRLQKENEILQTNAADAFQEGLNENQKLFENTILDSFAERLKKRFAYNVVIRNTIDNVLNSMKGKNPNEPSSM